MRGVFPDFPVVDQEGVAAAQIGDAVTVALARDAGVHARNGLILKNDLVVRRATDSCVHARQDKGVTGRVALPFQHGQLREAHAGPFS